MTTHPGALTMRRDGNMTTNVATAMVTIGFGLMFVAWNGAAGLDYVQGQLPFLLSGTLPGLGLVLTGLTLALVHEMRSSRAELIEHLSRLAPTEATEGPARTPAAVPDGDAVVATAATFHDPTCHVVDGRSDLTPMAPAAALDRGLNPCRICEPAAA